MAPAASCPALTATRGTFDLSASTCLLARHAWLALACALGNTTHGLAGSPLTADSTALEHGSASLHRSQGTKPLLLPNVQAAHTA